MELDHSCHTLLGHGDGAPESMRRVRLNAMLFSKGINEKQSKAVQEAKLRKEARRDVAVQDEINTESLAALRSFVTRCGDAVGAAGGSRQHRVVQGLIEVQGMLEEGAKGEGKGAQLLQKVAEVVRTLGGARVTHCKSGKDRTSMSATLEQMAVLSETLARMHLQHRGEAAAASVDGVAHEAAQASWLASVRQFGVRRDNVRLNIGRDTYAFNAVQQKFLPEEYRPPDGSAGKGPA